MQKDFELASGWKFLLALLGGLALYIFGRAVYGLLDLLTGYFFSPDVTLFRTMGIIFFSGIMIFFIIYVSFLAWYFLYKFRYEEISLSETCLEYQSFGFLLQVNWKNVKRIKSAGLFGLVNGVWVIPDQKKEWFRFAIKWLTSKNAEGEIFIPLSMFDVDWRDSDLGQQIKQYMPHLFQ